MSATSATAVRAAVAAEAEAARALDGRGRDDDPVTDADRLGEHPIRRDIHQLIEAAADRRAVRLVDGCIDGRVLVHPGDLPLRVRLSRIARSAYVLATPPIAIAAISACSTFRMCTT